MTPNVRVVSLQANNILRLSAVEFNWEENKRVLTLGGKNGAGKSSVLNAVAMALGGLSLCPAEPLKRGEQRGHVELNLGNLIVRREFWRDLLADQPVDGPPAYGDTKSRLVVKNADGVKQGPAQRLLDTLIGKLTFDPTAFAAEDEKKQADILRQIVGLDFSALDEARSIAYDKRAIYNKQYKDQLAVLDKMPHYENVPDAELKIDAVLAEIDSVTALERCAEDAEGDVSRLASKAELARVNTNHQKSSLIGLENQIAQLRLQLETLQQSVQSAVAAESKAIIALEAAGVIALAARKAVPSKEPLTAQLHSIEETNSKIRANTARHAAMSEVAKSQKQADEQDTAIKDIDAQKQKLLTETKYPIEGLRFTQHGAVSFNNVALKQASTAEQIRVSVAIGFALNPSLKLLCIKNGNALDEDSFKLIADAAEKAGGQVLMEIVTKKSEDVSVFIEDGHN